MARFIVFCLLAASVILDVQSWDFRLIMFAIIFLLFLGEISCTFTRSTKIIQCGQEKCSAVTSNTPLGHYKLGAVEYNSGKNKNWVNLYPKKKKGDGYWDYYCENPDTNRSKIALHPGSVSLGCISVPDQSCWNKLEKEFKRHTSSALSVTGVERSGWKYYKTFSCNGGLLAGKQITKTVYVVGSLEVKS